MAQSVRPRRRAALRVLFAGEASLFLQGLCSVVEQEPGIKVVGVADNLVALAAWARKARPHILVLQADAFIQAAAEQARTLSDGLPGVKVLVVCRARPKDCVSFFAASGAHGCVPWTAGARDLLRALRALRDGDEEGFFCHCAVSGRAPGLPMLLRRPRGAGGRSAWELTHRETQVLSLIARGLCNRSISHELGIGVRTVETYRMRLMRRLGIRSVAGLTRYALSVGLTSL
jgi:two-component system response regulator NreC